MRYNTKVGCLCLVLHKFLKTELDSTWNIKKQIKFIISWPTFFRYMLHRHRKQSYFRSHDYYSLLCTFKCIVKSQNVFEKLGSTESRVLSNLGVFAGMAQNDYRGVYNRRVPGNIKWIFFKLTYIPPPPNLTDLHQIWSNWTITFCDMFTG